MRQETALAFVPAQARAVATDFTGKWKNELGSTMSLVQNGSAVTGTYESAVSGGGRTVKGDLSGWANQTLISFAVNWPTAAITAWVGHLVTENGEDVIETLWQMTTGMPDPQDPAELWESVFAGTDRFERD